MEKRDLNNILEQERNIYLSESGKQKKKNLVF